MRGKVSVKLDALATAGITPAYAGKSGFLWYHIAIPPGSPPPMRGKEQMRGMSGIFYRITPAYAGKRSFHAISTTV